MTGTDLIEKIDYGFLTNFDPSLFKKELAQVDAIKDLAIKLKDQSILRRAAWYRAAKVAQAVDHYKGNVNPQGKHVDHAQMDAHELASELGFSLRTIQDWAQKITRPDGSIDAEEYAKSLLEAWLIAADIIERAVKESTGGGGGGGGGADPVETIWRAIEKVPEPSQRELYKRLEAKFAIKLEKGKKAKETKALPAPSYTDDDFTGIVEKPKDHRVAKAIEFFFEGVPVNKRLWVQQRMEEQETTLKGEGPQIEWVKAYWASDPEVQSAIREGIKLENTKRMEG